jgi:deoxyadenosine/deoxycytidine kinase
VSSQRPLRVAIVGPCTSGKSTLVAALRAAGYEARMPAQEHSYVAAMWQIMTKPDVLIYLDVTIEHARQRRQISWGADRLVEQAERLAHARQHADLYILTDTLTSDQVAARALDFLSTVTPP